MRMFPWLAAAALLIPGAASASSMVIGSGLARCAIEAADAERRHAGTLDTAPARISDSPSSYEDQVATFVNRGIIRARMNDFAGCARPITIARSGSIPNEPEAYLNKGALVLKTAA